MGRPTAETPQTTKRAVAVALRRKIRGIEEAAWPEQPHLPLGVPEIDRVLAGGGLRLGCIHEVVGDEAATGFCASLLARAWAAGPCGDGGRGALLWLARDDDLYAPGLVRFGIEAGQLLVVTRLRRQEDMLWTMEEALRSRAVAGVVAEAGGIGLVAGRRLMLAAEGTGALGLVLSRRAGGGGAVRGGGGVGGGVRGSGVRGAVSRWRVTAVPGGDAEGGVPETRWRVELLHCRGGKPGGWVVGDPP